MLDKEQLEKDRTKLMGMLQENEVQKQRILGALAYISDNLKEVPVKEEEHDRKE